MASSPGSASHATLNCNSGGKDLYTTSKSPLKCELSLNFVLFQVMESKGMAHHILEGMNLLRFNSQLCDVTLVVGEARLQAHRVVLAGASPIFAALFQKEMEGEFGLIGSIQE